MAADEVTELQAIIAQQQEAIDELKATVNQWRLNGAEDMFGGAGHQRFGAGIMQLDNSGIQLGTEGLEQSAFIFFVPKDEIGPSPSEVSPRSQVVALGDDDRALTRIGSVKGSGLVPDQVAQLATGVDSGGLTSPSARASLIAHNGSEGVQFDVISDGSSRRVQLFTQSGASTPTPFVVDEDTTDPASSDDGGLWYRSDTDKLRARINGSNENLATETYVDGNAGGGMSLVVKSADESVSSSVVLQDDDELTFAVGANEQWQFEGLLFLTGDTSGDFKYTFDGPSGAVGAFSIRGFDSQGTDEAQIDELGNTKVLNVNVDHIVVRFWGSIAVGGTGGNLTFQWAQNSSDATATVVHAGSYIKYQQAS